MTDAPDWASDPAFQEGGVIEALTFGTLLYPYRWTSFLHADPPEDWTCLGFHETMPASIPEEPGIYAFLVEPQDCGLRGRYLLYIGKASKSLRDRYRSYRATRQRRGRVKRMLSTFGDELRYCYFRCPSDDVTDWEDRFINAFNPHVNEVLPGDLRAPVAAFTKGVI